MHLIDQRPADLTIMKLINKSIFFFTFRNEIQFTANNTSLYDTITGNLRFFDLRIYVSCTVWKTRSCLCNLLLLKSCFIIVRICFHTGFLGKCLQSEIRTIWKIFQLEKHFVVYSNFEIYAGLMKWRCIKKFNFSLNSSLYCLHCVGNTVLLWQL